MTHNSGGNFEQGNIVVQVLKTGERKTLVQGGMYPRYLPSGHLVYARDNTIFVVPFNLNRLEVTGPPVPFLEHVAMNTGRGTADYSFSNAGVFVYKAGSNEVRNIVVKWMDKDGKFQPLRSVPGDYEQPRISPDGKRLALSVGDHGARDIWVYDWQRDTMSRLTFGPGLNTDPVWTPDGQHIAFSSTRGTTPAPNLYWMRADGTGQIEKLAESTGPQYPGSWSPDGKFLSYYEGSLVTGFDIWILPFEGDAKTGLKPGKPFVFLNTPASEQAPAFSPDGRWLAYHSNETGDNEVYVRPFPGPGGKWQVSNGRGGFPVWSKNGKELFYRTNTSPAKIMVSSYRVVGNAFQSDKPRIWSPGEVPGQSNGWSYDLAPDGKRFAVVEYAETDSTSSQKDDKFVLLLNAFDDLRRKAAAGK